jgi:hypothetical protein
VDGLFEVREYDDSHFNPYCVANGDLIRVIVPSKKAKSQYQSKKDLLDSLTPEQTKDLHAAAFLVLFKETEAHGDDISSHLTSTVSNVADDGTRKFTTFTPPKMALMKPSERMAAMTAIMERRKKKQRET